MFKTMNMSRDLSTEDISLSDSISYDDDIQCNEASVRIFECSDGGSCTILESSSGWKYQLLNVIKTSLFGMVVRAKIVASPSTMMTATSTSSSMGPYLHEMVAVKMYSRAKIDDIALGKVKEDPIAEISLLQNMRGIHLNVLTQYECCGDSESIYSIMPLLPGSELFDVVVDRGNLQEEEARVVFKQMAQGLQYLHEQGIAHQDISLENVLYDSEQSHRAVIIDFGLSVQCQSTKDHILNTRAGKLFYMSPEMYSGKPTVEPFASDMWSMGICLLYMLIGFPPIQHACADDVRFQYVRDGRLKELLQHWDIVLSDSVLSLIESMLQIMPQDRISIERLLAHSWFQEGQNI